MAFDARSCPACGVRVNLWRVTWLRGREGVKCPNCASLLKARMGLRVVVMLSVFIGGVFVAAHFRVNSGALLGVAVGLLYLLSLLLSAYFVRFTMVPPGEDVRTDLITERAEAEQIERVMLAKAEETYTKTHPKWHCSGCGEENPHEFELCWRCQQPHRDAI